MNLISCSQFSAAHLALIIGIYWLLIFNAQVGGGEVNAQRSDGNFKSPCGTAEQVSRRLGACVSELIDLGEGRGQELFSDADIQNHLCGRFNKTERCARALAKECLSSGLHKTSIIAVASATRHWRQTECATVESRARYFEPMKCLIKSGPEMQRLYATNTGVLQGIRDLPNMEPEFKLKKVCCLLNRVDKETSQIYDKNCPQYSNLLLTMVHTMTDDARKTLCARPRCNQTLGREVESHKYTPPQNIMEPAMQVVFQMSRN